MTYFIGGMVGAAFALAISNKLLYPPPDIHGVQLGLVAASILIGGAGVGVAIVCRTLREINQIKVDGLQYVPANHRNSASVGMRGEAKRGAEAMTVTIRHGDCRQVLQTMAAGSVNCCVTSPPYFGLRDYGVAGQIGLEPTPDEFVAEMVAVFRGVRRVLRDDGTLWLNLGDSYGGPKNNTAMTGGKSDKARGEAMYGGITMSFGKPKNLIGIPWRVAFALQADGWYLRQDIIWSKPNPMPESVTDRCTKAHEYIFLLSKSPRYFYDAEAIKEESVTDDPRRPYGSKGAWEMDGRAEEQRHGGEPRSFKGSKFNEGKTAEHQLDRASDKPRAPANVKRGGFNGKTNDMPGSESFRAFTETRNKRSVWTVATQSFKEAHFATFPPALIEPCIKAGCPEGGTVLDPFGGAGTTGLVADRLRRDAILIELNPEYAAIATRRINGDGGMLTSVVQA